MRSETAETESLPYEIIGKLENEFMVLWQETCKTRIFSDIEKFADKIRTLGDRHSSILLTGYGQELIAHTRNFDIEKVKTLLYSYPKLIKNIGIR